MKTFREFLEEAYLVEMRRQDRGKGPTPLYINPEITKSTIKKSPEGRWKKTTTTTRRFAGKGIINPEVSLARMRRTTGPSVGLSGYISSPQDPGAPQPHGTSGGVPGHLRGVRQKGTPKNYPIGDVSTQREIARTKSRYKTPAERVERERQRRRERFSGGYDYKTRRIV